jgi:hypothetical protein
MSAKDLIDISKRPDFKELTARGGRNMSPKKMLARLRQHSAKARCKNCKLQCDFKEGCLARDAESLCAVPIMRADAITNGTSVTEWNDDKIKLYLNKLIDMYHDAMIENPTYDEDDDKKKETLKIRRLNTMYNRLIEMKQTFNPATQKSVNVNMNIDLFGKQMEEWKKSLQAEREKEIVLENGNKIVVINERSEEDKLKGVSEEDIAR